MSIDISPIKAIKRTDTGKRYNYIAKLSNRFSKYSFLAIFIMFIGSIAYISESTPKNDDFSYVLVGILIILFCAIFAWLLLLSLYGLFWEKRLRLQGVDSFIAEKEELFAQIKHSIELGAELVQETHRKINANSELEVWLGDPVICLFKVDMIKQWFTFSVLNQNDHDAYMEIMIHSQFWDYLKGIRKDHINLCRALKKCDQRNAQVKRYESLQIQPSPKLH